MAQQKPKLKPRIHRLALMCQNPKYTPVRFPIRNRRPVQIAACPKDRLRARRPTGTRLQNDEIRDVGQRPQRDIHEADRACHRGWRPNKAMFALVFVAKVLGHGHEEFGGFR